MVISDMLMEWINDFFSITGEKIKQNDINSDSPYFKIRLGQLCPLIYNILVSIKINRQDPKVLPEL
ncbi:hypothetical protein [Dysgonomonas sp. ZJ279]|uniref:hypothetical protein n=1 Tax=Dysgonomonas sp. ZJ279 TaxID=2709796 RepID=UPI0013EE0D4E|nr:hypothetical protein [Dysgonomonas sp. ZJ279]